MVVSFISSWTKAESSRVMLPLVPLAFAPVRLALNPFRLTGSPITPFGKNVFDV